MIVARAPMRVSFGGGGTDLPAYYLRYRGMVVSAAITRYCYVMLDQPVDGGVTINSGDYRAWSTGGGQDAPVMGGPLALPMAALGLFDGDTLRRTGVRMFLSSEAPPGSGLGSSSAMAVALVRALAAYTGQDMGEAEVADVACHLEIDVLGAPIGKQDQYASAYGGINTIAFSASGVAVTPLGLPDEVTSALQERLLLFWTGQARDSADILRRQASDTSDDERVVASLHHMKGLALEMRDALLRSDPDTFGLLLDRVWQEKRQLSANVSSGAIDRWYDAARRAGALGGKITGAGGGGFLLLYCPLDAQDLVRATMQECGLRELPFDVDHAGARAHRVGRGDERGCSVPPA